MKLNKEQLHRYLDALKHVERFNGSDSGLAICAILGKLLNYNEGDLVYEFPTVFLPYQQTLYESWDYWSGSEFYPVPCPESLIDAFQEDGGQYFDDSIGMSERVFDNTEFMWRGEYGRLRYDLLRHLIRCVERDLENYNEL